MEGVEKNWGAYRNTVCVRSDALPEKRDVCCVLAQLVGLFCSTYLPRRCSRYWQAGGLVVRVADRMEYARESAIHRLCLLSSFFFLTAGLMQSQSLSEEYCFESRGIFSEVFMECVYSSQTITGLGETDTG